MKLHIRAIIRDAGNARLLRTCTSMAGSRRCARHQWNTVQPGSTGQTRPTAARPQMNPSSACRRNGLEVCAEMARRCRRMLRTRRRIDARQIYGRKHRIERRCGTRAQPDVVADHADRDIVRHFFDGTARLRLIQITAENDACGCFFRAEIDFRTPLSRWRNVAAASVCAGNGGCSHDLSRN